MESRKNLQYLKTVVRLNFYLDRNRVNISKLINDKHYLMNNDIYGCDNVRFLSPRTIVLLALRALFPELTSKIC